MNQMLLSGLLVFIFRHTAKRSVLFDWTSCTAHQSFLSLHIGEKKAYIDLDKILRQWSGKMATVIFIRVHFCKCHKTVASNRRIETYSQYPRDSL